MKNIKKRILSYFEEIKKEISRNCNNGSMGGNCFVKSSNTHRLSITNSEFIKTREEKL
jgi:hypothetical protein